MPTSIKSLTHFVYDDIKTKIFKGELPPDKQLVNRTIAKKLNVSTIPVREAIQRLVSEGMVEHRHGDGFFVRVLNKRELTELYELREAIDPLAAGYLARDCTPAIVQQFEAILTEWEKIGAELVRDMGSKITSDQMIRWIEREEQFQTLVATACGNAWFANIMSCIRQIVYAFYFHRVHPEAVNAPLAVEVLKNHRKFVELIAAKNVDGAAEWMRNHVRMLKGYMVKFATD